MTTSNPAPPPPRRIRISLKDRQFAGLFWQVLVVGITVAIIAWLWSNTVHNLSVRRISTGFAFLGREAGMPIADTWIPYSPKDPYLRAFIVGLANTLRVAVIGIVLATVLGTIIGIARLSSNWLLSRLAAVYVEVLRDVPLLLQLLFWYVLMQGLPAARCPARRNSPPSLANWKVTRPGAGSDPLVPQQPPLPTANTRNEAKGISFMRRR